ncbi:hypothetical protein [Cellulomonas xylanilytica]|uniref:Uncharacterized protein n=1 Tax=Cellulomonas xylanilytica TaxID=233583 RepID=A0A510VBP9_9CELL|nr:hypothetical protein [Cellulomonas xylanilytica]GEK22595.1 hypothetical protein CXY01_31150 [Cellulomonas xylanilytica]
MAPSRTFRRATALAAAPVAILAAGALVWQSSTAAFTATTRNAGNSWSTGQVLLTDDDQGRAGFTVTGLVPGQTGEKCLVVTSGSTVPGEVRSYAQNLRTSGSALADRIRFRVEQGTGGSFDDCTGFTPAAGALPAQSLTTLSQVNFDYATGGGVWKTTGTPGESRTYRGTWTFDTTGLTQAQIDALQGAQVTMDLVWELQSTEPTAP